MQEAQEGIVKAVSVNVQADNDEDSLEHVRLMLETFVIAFMKSTQMAMYDEMRVSSRDHNIYQLLDLYLQAPHLYVIKLH